MLCRNFVPDQNMPYRVTIPDYKGESKTTGKNIALIDKPLRIRLTICPEVPAELFAGPLHGVPYWDPWYSPSAAMSCAGVMVVPDAADNCAAE
jgi:hypothetical protein